MSVSKRFVGLSLSADDRARLREQETCGEKLSVRSWRRVRTLLLLDKGFTVTSTAEAVGGYPREISRVGKRYLEGGLEHALSDDARPIPAPLLDSTQLAAVVAMVCGPAPSGRARWTVRLVAEHAVARGIAPKMGRETARVALAEHGLKPWREKNVVRAGNRSGVHRSNGGRA
jgi:putative transposase